ncbi:MAG: hypothetical protein AAB426_07435 [Myxococcota bacterium]
MRKLMVLVQGLVIATYACGSSADEKRCEKAADYYDSCTADVKTLYAASTDVDACVESLDAACSKADKQRLDEMLDCATAVSCTLSNIAAIQACQGTDELSTDCAAAARELALVID